MSKLKIKNARIEGTMLGIEGHGILTAFLYLEYDGGGQGFGGYSIEGPYASKFIKRVLEVVGVEEWEELKGKHIRVKATSIKVHEIGNILEDKWFNPRREFVAMEVKEKLTTIE